MEYVGAISEVEWNSFDGMCSDEANFMEQLLGNSSLANEVSSNFWPVNVNISGVDESLMYSLDETNTYSGGSSVLFPSLGHESFYMNVPHQIFVTNNNLMGMDYCLMDYSNENFLQERNITLGEEIETPIPDTLKKDKVRNPSEISRKRPRIPAGESKSKKNMKLKNEDVNKNNHAVLHRQKSNTLCSEDDSNASHELCGVTSSSNGVSKSNRKIRASKGSATDPQSLYARKRRERINERLRILQNLVPNGTKVDISTMLEEAVQYVKFLQLQIKLLSSDDHWMYAPLAYNGMDIGLDVKISAQKP